MKQLESHFRVPYKSSSNTANLRIQKQPPEVFCEEISQNPLENTCVRVSLLKKSFWHRSFPVDFVKILRTASGNPNSNSIPHKSSYTNYLIVWEMFVLINFRKLKKLPFHKYLLLQIRQSINFMYINFYELRKTIHWSAYY